MPLLICALLGLGAVWKSRKQEFYYPVLWVALLAIGAFLWRLPVAMSARHNLPLTVPAVLLAVLFFRTGWSLPTRFAKGLCAIVFLVVLIAGAGKAMRPQSPKPYLRELPIALDRDAAKFNRRGKIYLITLGNVGGHVGFADHVEDNQINVGRSFDKYRDAFLKSLDAKRLHPLLLQRPVVYLLVRTGTPANVVSEMFQSRYDLPFELVYESRDRKRYVQLYRIVSPYPCGHLPAAARSAGYDKGNLLYNNDFRIRPESSGDAGSDAVKSIGVAPGWRAELNSRCPTIQPGMISYAGSGNIRLKSDQGIYLYQDQPPLPGNRRYQVRARVVARKITYFFIDVKQRHSSGLKLLRRVLSRSLPPGQYELHEVFDLAGSEEHWIFEFGIVGGDLEIAGLSLVDAAIFEHSEQQIKSTK